MQTNQGALFPLTSLLVAAVALVLCLVFIRWRSRRAVQSFVRSRGGKIYLLGRLTNAAHFVLPFRRTEVTVAYWGIGRESSTEFKISVPLAVSPDSVLTVNRMYDLFNDLDLDRFKGGDAEFDDLYKVESNDRHLVERFLTPDMMRHLIQIQFTCKSIFIDNSKLTVSLNSESHFLEFIVDMAFRIFEQADALLPNN